MGNGTESSLCNKRLKECMWKWWRTLSWVLIFSDWSLTEVLLLTLKSQEQKTFVARFPWDLRTWNLLPRDVDTLQEKGVHIKIHPAEWTERKLMQEQFTSCRTCTPGWCRWWRRRWWWWRNRLQGCCMACSGTCQNHSLAGCRFWSWRWRSNRKTSHSERGNPAGENRRRTGSKEA